MRGREEWTRYPPRIEAALEDMSRGFLCGPKFMYRPGDPECDGMYARMDGLARSGSPPAGVATRHVIFADMTEREVYTGRVRDVRRNGARDARAHEDDDDEEEIDVDEDEDAELMREFVAQMGGTPNQVNAARSASASPRPKPLVSCRARLSAGRPHTRSTDSSSRTTAS